MSFFDPNVIRYYIPMEPTGNLEKESAFAGFTRNLIDKTLLLEFIAKSPFHVKEFSQPTITSLKVRRTLGSYGIVMLDSKFVREFAKNDPGFFKVFLSTETTYDAVTSITENLNEHCIHFSTKVDGRSSIFLGDVSLRRYRREIKKSIEKNFKGKDLYWYRYISSKKPRSLGRNIRYEHFQHLTTSSNQYLLNFSKVKMERLNDLKPMLSNRAVEKNIMSSYFSVLDLTKNLSLDSSKNDVHLIAPSIYALFYQDRNFIRNISKSDNSRIGDVVKKTLIRFESYLGTMNGVKNVEEFFSNETLNNIRSIRRDEIASLTALSSIICSEDSCPSVRLPNGVNLCHHMLSELENTVNNGRNQKDIKINRIYTKYISHNNRVIPEAIAREVISKSNKILFVSDQPLELMSVDGKFPLLIKHETSRIPSTPGNALSSVITNSNPLLLNKSDLSKILIIRSFSPEDPIKNLVEISIDQFLNGQERAVDIKIVDVTTKAEVVEALNNFQGNIVIFDCHGDHGGKSDTSWLCIGKEKVSSWFLYQEARIPPIVILSACSTLPISGSHASVANGFVSSGAISVLCASVKIPAVEASILMGRLVYRIDSYLKGLLDFHETPISWRYFINNMLRMSYSTDILTGFLRKELIDINQYTAIHEDANLQINVDYEEWFQVLLNRVAEGSGRSLKAVEKIYTSELRFNHTLCYTQFGRPEIINMETHDPFRATRFPGGKLRVREAVELKLKDRMATS
ncbi:hypothetical protein [Bacterioplanoides pacificum]|uniref:CHAT domain-containing protein n=1 Tax=Bacterioplanoides pacificum TaxID=1171596 RepID=A0ABV7VUH6_9GAMM